ncbi:response regulator [Candidatus Manganitrophus noduliformans]|uniref:Response regulator n=1 Tax=Candidatus Manganitrophus noduliformans TaxID=2606439 RepID=A0A7X6ICQ3_9BACT|nr:response regulator [Candidatus Manganitrophus noduliformans]NKE72938.1 response regulator [Candidatus Manganitrophus noduliformans]
MSFEEKINILLVDDKPNNLMLLEAILESPEYHLVKAASGMEALKYILKEDFAVILLDVMMPEMDGFETAKRLKQRDQSKDIPILFVTAMDPEEAMFKADLSGAVDYLFKPFDSDTLRSKVALFVDLHKKNRLLWRK